MHDYRKLQMLALCSIPLIVSGSALAQDADDAAPDSGESASLSDRVHVSLSLDYTSQYFFRGLVQETDGLILQPGIEIGFDLVDNDDFTLGAYVGGWSSFHDERTGATDPDEFVSRWYEFDFYAGVSMSSGRFSADVAYTNYTAPNGAFGHIDEVIVTLAWDDSGWLDWVTLSPYATVAIEFGANQGDGGSDLGTFFALGIEPSHTYESTPFGEITVSAPIEAGFSLSDYYEGATGDETFGYLSSGLAVSIPLPAPEGFGDWTWSAGVDYLLLGDTTEAINGGDDDEWIIHTGISFEF